MKFWKKNTDMSLRFDFLYKEGFLEPEVILFAEEPGHATIIILEGTDR
jgi:hypothetical protein